MTVAELMHVLGKMQPNAKVFLNIDNHDVVHLVHVEKTSEFSCLLSNHVLKHKKQEIQMDNGEVMEFQPRVIRSNVTR